MAAGAPAERAEDDEREEEGGKKREFEKREEVEGEDPNRETEEGSGLKGEARAVFKGDAGVEIGEAVADLGEAGVGGIDGGKKGELTDTEREGAIVLELLDEGEDAELKL